MAARINTKFTPYDRAKIKVALMVRLLEEHAAGLNRMSATRVRACEILLKKVMPDLASLEHKGELTENVRYVAEMPVKDKTTEDWMATHGKRPSKPNDVVH